MVVTQVERQKIKIRAGRRAYRQEGLAAEEALKTGEQPVVIIAASKDGEQVIAQEAELVRLFNATLLPKGRHRPNTPLGPRRHG